LRCSGLVECNLRPDARTCQCVVSIKAVKAW
jgi:hypothetical protein